MPHAQVAIVPGSHGGFNRINELNDRIAAFIKAHATDKQAVRRLNCMDHPYVTLRDTLEVYRRGA